MAEDLGAVQAGGRGLSSVMMSLWVDVGRHQHHAIRVPGIPIFRAGTDLQNNGAVGSFSLYVHHFPRALLPSEHQ